MGKNQAYKAMQRAKMSTHAGAAPGEEEVNDGFMDGSFHSPEWHKARLASLQTSHTVTWEEWKKKQKEDDRLKNELADDEEQRMVEYRKQLDAERASKLARGRNHAGPSDKSKKSKKDKDKDKDRKSEKKKKRREREKKRHGGDDSDSDSSDSEDSREKLREKRKKKSRRRSKKRRHSSGSSSSSESEKEGEGPVRLSEFFTDAGDDEK
eukprot:jgi/Mesen1/9500/ME000633S08857